MLKAPSCQLFDYQLDAVIKWQHHYRLALFWQMRLGKSLTFLRWLKNKKVPPQRVLIVCPKTVKLSWQIELEKEGIDYLDFDSKCPELMLNWVKDKPIYVLTHYEYITRGPENGLHTMAWDAVCVDEGTRLRNGRTKTAEIFWDHSNFPFSTDDWQPHPDQKHQYRAILTGTPDPESDLDYFSYFKFLYDGLNLPPMIFRSVRHFKSTCFEYDYLNDDIRLKLTWRRRLTKYLSTYADTLSRRDVGRDTPNVYQKRFVQLPPDARKQYDQFEKDWFMEFCDELRQNMSKLDNRSFFQLETEFATAAQMYLHQLAIGYPKDKGIVWDHKLNEVKNIMRELGKEKVVIWSNYRRPIDVLCSSLSRYKPDQLVGGQTVAESKELVRRFNLPYHHKDAINTLVCQVKKASMGIDLSVADTQIRFANSWSSLDYEQSIDRLQHPTKAAKDSAGILTIEIVTENTIDEDVHQALVHKKTRQELMRMFLKRSGLFIQ